MQFATLPLQGQLILALAALILFTSFLLLAESRLMMIINLFAFQGVLVSITTALVAFEANEHHLYISAILTFILKALFIPWSLRYLVKRLNIEREQEDMVRPGVVLMVAAALVIFSYYMVLPVQAISFTVTRPTVAISLALVLLGMLMMVTRRLAVNQVVGFMAIENGLFFAGVAVTQGMPMIIELGIGFDVLVATVIFGVFFFHIKESIDSLDTDRMNKLSEVEQ